MRLTRLERKAALAVAGMTVAVVVSGVKLLNKHARYMSQKAAAFFKEPGGDQTAASGSEQATAAEKDQTAAAGSDQAATQETDQPTAAEEKKDDGQTAKETEETGTAGNPGSAE